MSSTKPFWPMNSAWTRLASASTTEVISPSRRLRSCSRRLPAVRGAILLGSAVTVLSTDDPVRVFERFSTLDAVSNGRAEVILGRGSFTESYPLFGYDLSRYEELFEDKLSLFAELLKGGPVTWNGSTRVGGLRRVGSTRRSRTGGSGPGLAWGEARNRSCARHATVCR